MIPIDFSETSIFALKTGLAMANRLSADLRLVYVINKQDYARGFEQERLSESSPARTLDRLLLENRQEYFVKDGKFDYKIRNGQVTEELVNQARYDDTTLVVMGSHGVSGITERWIGSNAYRMICLSPCPVLIIRPDMHFDNRFRNMAITVDINKSSRQKLPTVAAVARLFDSKLTIIGLQHTGWSSIFERVTRTMNQVERYFANTMGLTVADSILLRGKKLDEQLAQTIAESKADIIALDVKNTGYFLADRFRPFLISVVNKSKCPVLAIPIKE